MASNRAIWLVAAVGVFAGSQSAAAQEYPTLSHDEELRLAMSAGPLTVSSDADVYVLGATGFEQAIEGNNGWACLVVRNAQNRGVLAPHCLNPAAEQTVLPAFLLEAKLQMEGLDQNAISQELAAQWESKRLPMPEGPAFAYMLSKGQRIGPQLGSFKPHFMMYQPYVTNEAIGGDPQQQQFGFVGPFENHPLATVVIIMNEFVDPADVVLPNR